MPKTSGSFVVSDPTGNRSVSVPREVKVVDTPTLLELEERACGRRLNKRLDPVWVQENVAGGGAHYLRPALWHSLDHRPDIPRHLRCELLVELRTGDRVLSLLDVRPAEFAPLARVISRDEGLEVARLLSSVPTVREWLLKRANKAE
ncbi:hypothetical protein [Oerskovia sp. USHLN155]|uniref:hypothetical protein n=1 Tax=Oerskovia sp. USHLN155 TaxID=3081288 RepID=UPI0030161D02